jgi:hypothetical protein
MPRGELTVEQAAKVDMLKAASPEFASLRGLATRFHGIMKGADPGKPDPWVDDALRREPLRSSVRFQMKAGCRRCA